MPALSTTHVAIEPSNKRSVRATERDPDAEPIEYPEDPEDPDLLPDEEEEYLDPDAMPEEDPLVVPHSRGAASAASGRGAFGGR